MDMDWFFDGLGTLIIGLLIGGAGGTAIGWRIAIRKTRLTQTARDSAIQIQSGKDTKLKGTP